MVTAMVMATATVMATVMVMVTAMAMARKSRRERLWINYWAESKPQYIHRYITITPFLNAKKGVIV